MCDWDQDYLARDRIVGDTAHNFFVEAGAGSGKTTVLVSRMVAMVENGVDVSKICAITFTKAAANEFYDRFQKMLLQRANDYKAQDTSRHGELPTATDETRRRCAEAVRHIDSCFMGTIDSFCNMILSEHPAKAKIPSNAAVRSDDDMYALWRKAYADILRGTYGAVLQEKATLYRTVHKQADQLFCDAMTTVMGVRNSKIVYAPPILPDLTVRNEFVSVLKRVIQHPEWVYNGAAKSAESFDILKHQIGLLEGDWKCDLPHVIKVLKGIANLRLIPQVDIEQINAFTDLFTEHTKNGKVGWYALNQESDHYLLSALTEYQYSVSMDFFVSAMPVIVDRFRAAGDLTFNDYLFYLRDVLKADAENGGTLIQHIYERHSYFLIDEFQDTNPIQGEIFFYLTAEEPQKNWFDCVPKPGSLFIVGDPKQSIYRFREADVSAFLKVKELFQGAVGEVLYLQRNFRSTKPIRTWFNEVFTNLLPITTENQSQFDAIPLDNVRTDHGNFGGVYSYSCAKGRNVPESEQDAYKITAIIQRLVNNPAYTIQEKNDSQPRAIEYRDFMLITPSKGKLDQYMQAFVRHRIPFYVEGKVEFDACPALVALSKVLKAIADPNEPAALYGALTGCLFRVTKERLYAFKNHHGVLSVFADVQDIDGEIGRIFEILRDFVYRSANMPMSVLFMTVYDTLRIAEKCGVDNLDYLYYALELIRHAESTGVIASLTEGSDYLEGLLRGTLGVERAISLKEDRNRVHIANLHKVKGLEAPIVLLAGQTEKTHSADRRTEQHEDGPVTKIFSIQDHKTHFPVIQTAVYAQEKQKEEDSLAAEKIRLLYVAATRARRALIIGYQQSAKGTPLPSNAWSAFIPYCPDDFFAKINQENVVTQQAVETVDATALYAEAEAKDILKQTASKEKSYVTLRPSMIKLKSTISSEDDFEDSDDHETRTHTVRNDAALIGTLVHRLMEMMVTANNQLCVADTVQDIIREYNCVSDKYSTMLQEVATTMQNGGYAQRVAVPQDLLTTLFHAEEVHCELPFCYQNGDTLYHGVIDVLYAQGGKWYILDYKTNAEAESLDEKYADQLDAYVQAVKVITGEDAVANIYHIGV